MLQILSHTSHTFVVNRMKIDKNRKFCCIVEQRFVYLQYGKTPKKEIEKAKILRKEYYADKQSSASRL